MGSLEKKFGEEAMKQRLGLTPVTPRFTAMRLIDDQDELPTNDHAISKSVLKHYLI